MFKNHTIALSAIISVLIITGCNTQSARQLYSISINKIPVPGIEYMPESYVCYRSGELNIDGLLNENDWKKTEWTGYFVDIEGELKPSPLHKTRAKMLWDKEYLYIAAELTEPDIQARLRQRDTVIFYDNDFEVFIDPDGDTHGYYELELNAFNTVWDLLLTKPYRDSGNRVLDAWDISGLKSAVYIDGSLNNPSDEDKKWTVEIAIPFDVLSEWGNIPVEGTQWRINFSRVNWKWEAADGIYQKKINPETGKNYPEFNWVWSPQGVINMHYPEMWGYLQFTENMVGEKPVRFIKNSDEDLKWKLRQLYYAQRIFAADKGYYASFIRELNKELNIKLDRSITILNKAYGYEAYIVSGSSGLTWIIRDDGRVFSMDK